MKFTQEEAQGPTAKPVRQSASSVALDQWRGLALILVLIQHGFHYTGRMGGVGRIGVNLFFFISGLLVYRSLTGKKAGEGFAMVSSFWKRRLIRLYPALAAYVLLMLPVIALLQHQPNLPKGSDLATYLKAVPYALFYLVDCHQSVPFSMGHLWSISVEMQFYILAPLIFILGGTVAARRYGVFGGVLLLLVAIALGYPLLSHGGDAYAKYQFQCAAWPMMLGFFCEFSKGLFAKLGRTFAKLVLVAGGLAFLALIAAFSRGSGAKAMVVVGAVLVWPCYFAYLFGMPFPGVAGETLAWLGQRTYSIYLWQQPLTLCDYLPAPLQPLGALVSILVGGVSFLFFERPFLSGNRIVERLAR